MVVQAAGSNRFATYFLRLLVIGFGFCVSALVAGFAFMVAIRGSRILEIGPNDSLSGHLLTLLLFGVLIAGVAGVIVAIPAFIAILASEAFALSGLAFHLATGTAIGWLAVVVWEHGQNTTSGEPSAGLAGAAAGAIGAFVYWLIAGRRAGHWLPRKSAISA